MNITPPRKIARVVVVLAATLWATSALSQDTVEALAPVSTGADDTPISEPLPPDNAHYRAQADVRLEMVFQGIAESGISKGLRFFGTSGYCEAWYEIEEVTTTPANMQIQAGDRLKLNYKCGDGREYVNPSSASPALLTWAMPTSIFIRAWFASADVREGRGRTWVVENPNNWFAPVAIESANNTP